MRDSHSKPQSLSPARLSLLSDHSVSAQAQSLHHFSAFATEEGEEVVIDVDFFEADVVFVVYPTRDTSEGSEEGVESLRVCWL